MKRDPDLCRKILLAVEAHPRPFDVPLEMESFSEDEVAYNAEKLSEAGYLIADNISEEGKLTYRVHRLTHKGHDLVELVRKDAAWRNAMEMLESKVHLFTFELLEKVLTELVTFTLSDFD